MAKRRKKRTCQHCGGEFKSWHAHVDCKPDEPVIDPATPEPEQPAFKPRMIVGGTTVWRRT